MHSNVRRPRMSVWDRRMNGSWSMARRVLAGALLLAVPALKGGYAHEATSSDAPSTEATHDPSADQAEPSASETEPTEGAPAATADEDASAAQQGGRMGAFGAIEGPQSAIQSGGKFNDMC